MRPDEDDLRGVQIADDDGKVSWSSILPACCSGRWPHVHVEVCPDQDSITDAANAIATSQVALPKAARDAVSATAGDEASVADLAPTSPSADDVVGDDSGAPQPATVSGDVTAGYAVSLAVGVDTATAPTAGAAPAGGGGDGQGGGPGGTPPASR